MDLIEKYLGEARKPSKPQEYNKWFKNLEKVYKRYNGETLKQMYADKDRYRFINSFKDIAETVVDNVSVEPDQDLEGYKSELEASIEGYIDDAKSYFEYR